MKVVCINDQARPADFPLSKWITKGKEYHITKIERMSLQNGLLGCQLAEIDLSDQVQYKFFSLARFALPEDLEKIKEMEKQIQELVCT